MRLGFVFMAFLMAVSVLCIFVGYGELKESEFCERQIVSMGFSIGEVDAFLIEKNTWGYCEFLNSERVQEEYRQWLAE